MSMLDYFGAPRVRCGAAAPVVFGVLCFALIVSAKAHAQEFGRCQTGGNEGAALLNYGRELATNSDSIHVATRQRYHIPATDSSNVTLVTSDSVCALAGDAYNAHLSVARRTANRAVYVLRIGSVYIVTDPRLLPAGVHGLIPNMVFDADFALLAQFAA